MKFLCRIVLSSLVFFAGWVNAAGTANFDAATNTLTLSTIKVDSGFSVQSVVVRFQSFGTLAIDDASVGSDITYDSKTNTIRIPSVTVGTASYPRIRLTNPVFSLVSFGAIVADAGTTTAPATPTNYNLDITVTAAGVTVAPIRVANVPKPSGQGDFCVADIYKQFQQSVQGVSGTWSITSCSFNGTTGQIAAQISINTGFIPVSFSYSITYTYSPA